MLDPAEFAAWLRLLMTPAVGRETSRRLLASFGAPQAIFEASAGTLRSVVDAPTAAALTQPPAEFEQRLNAALAWLGGGERREVITLGDAAYPARLLQTADPPLLLYVQGDAALLSAPSVAVVGSRQATAQGLDNARSFSRQLADAGLAIVSGLALGIDGAAHEGALAARAGTIAVVGTGLDIVYPRRHLALAHRISEHGVLVSEFAPGTPALPPNFPLRNRVIAGLALGTLVVEAAARSGSLITARLASEAGREVYAIPGSIHAEQSHGCHALIRQGAMLVESAQDIIDDLAGGPRPVAADAVATPTSPARRHDPVLQALGADPLSLDTLSARTGWGAGDLSARLLDLELEGLVARLPGGLYQRRFAG